MVARDSSFTDMPHGGVVGCLQDERQYLTVMIEGQKHFFAVDSPYLDHFCSTAPGSRLRRMLASPGRHHEMLALSYNPGALANKLAAMDSRKRSTTAALYSAAKPFIRQAVFDRWLRQRSKEGGGGTDIRTGISRQYTEFWSQRAAQIDNNCDTFSGDEEGSDDYFGDDDDFSYVCELSSHVVENWEDLLSDEEYEEDCC